MTSQTLCIIIGIMAMYYNKSPTGRDYALV